MKIIISIENGVDMPAPVTVCIDGQEVVVERKSDSKAISEIIEPVELGTTEQMALLPIEPVEKEPTKKNCSVFFTMGYSPTLEFVRKIIACGVALEKRRNDTKLKLDNEGKGAIIQGLIKRKGIDMAVHFNKPLSSQGDKVFSDAFIYLAWKVWEQCWENGKFSKDVVMLPLKEFKDVKSSLQKTDLSARLRAGMRFLKHTQIRGTIGQDTPITESEKFESLVIDYWTDKKSGNICARLNPYMWQLLTEQSLVLPKIYFSLPKLERALVYNIFNEIKELCPNYSSQNIAANADHLVRKGIGPSWDKQGIDVTNEKAQRAFEKTKRILAENRKLLGVSIQTKWDSDIDSSNFLKNSEIEISIPKKVSDYYKAVMHEHAF